MFNVPVSFVSKHRNALTDILKRLIFKTVDTKIHVEAASLFPVCSYFNAILLSRFRVQQ